MFARIIVNEIKFDINLHIHLYFQTLGVGQSRSRRHSIEAFKRKLSLSLEKDDYQPLQQEVQYAHLQNLL